MTLELAKELIRRPSVTPDDAGCQALLAERLAAAGCVATQLRFAEVDNLWLTHGSGEPVLAFLGHTDVVAPGPLAKWHSHPFAPSVRDGYLYGRGAADMKGSVAAMVTAMERFITSRPAHPGTLALLLTSDEEGIAINGTRKVVDYLNQQGIAIRWCVVGEPSSNERLGDVIKNGRRGSLTAELTVRGQQGHVAYPELAENPIHRLTPALNELCTLTWDKGNAHYPATSFQIASIHAGSGASNVIPGAIDLVFNFRYCTASTEDELVRRVEATLDKFELHYELNWLPSSKPFLTESGDLIEAVKSAIATINGYEPELSTAGGTSDGRFIAPTGAEVLELGPVNASIHKVNECVRIDDLDTLSRIYENILLNLLSSS